jgi:hypothetical protein
VTIFRRRRGHPLGFLVAILPSRGTLTISGGSVTVSGGGCYNLETQDADANDNLDTIANSSDCQLYVFRLVSSARQVTFRHAVDNLRLPDGLDTELRTLADWILCMAHNGVISCVPFVGIPDS